MSGIQKSFPQLLELTLYCYWICGPDQNKEDAEGAVRLTK